MTERPDIRYRIVQWIGIINQLSVTRANRLLADIDLPWPQFLLLNHFSHRPDEGKTVMDIARAMQQQQPAVSKTVKHMVAGGLLRWEPNPEDARSRLLYRSRRGAERYREALGLLLPTLEQAFAEWPEERLDRLFGDLDRLKIWFDEHR